MRELSFGGESLAWVGVVLVILMAVSAFFSASEASYLALNRIRLRHLREKHVRGADRVYRLIGRLDELITTVLVCNNLVNTAIAAIASVFFVELFGTKWGVLLSTFAVTFLLIIFCETTPKIYATRHPEFVSFGARHVVNLLITVFSPMVRISNAVSELILRLFGIQAAKRVPLVTEEEIKLMIRVGKEEGYYGESERRMLEKIFHFDEIEVREVMTPIEKMVMIDVRFDENALADTLMEEGHNRIPVYDGDPQNIVGILYVHDLLYLIKNHQLIRLQDLLSAPYFVPPDKKASILLKEFQSRKVQIALVKSRAGKILGLVTLEDLIEEIVGEIEELTPIS